MCGIAAISLSPTSTIPVRQLAHNLLLHSEERGKVASGFGFHHAGNNNFVKDAKPGGHLSLQMLPKDARTVIVHTRNATYGDPDDNENNHPVADDRGEIILVHNGVITNHTAIRDGEKDVVFPEVDSSVLPWLIREHGVAGLEHIDGWAAVAWLDKLAPGELNLARVQGAAPMVVVSLKDGSTVMASTFPILHASLIGIGYGDQIVGGWEVPDLTHIRVKAGVIAGLGNIPKHLVHMAKYKSKALSYQEKQRLEKITNGDAVSYGKDAPKHEPPPATKPGPVGSGQTKAPTAGSTVSGGGTPPPSTQSAITQSKSYPSQFNGQMQDANGERKYKPGDDPMAAFKKQGGASMPVGSGTSTVYTSGYGGKVWPKHPITDYLERRLDYWVQYFDKDGNLDPEYDDQPFSPADFNEDYGYMYNIFVELCEYGAQHKFIARWGIFNEKGERMATEHLTAEQEVEYVKGTAAKLKARGKRTPPKVVVGLGAMARGPESPDDVEPEEAIEDDDTAQSLRDLGFDPETGEVNGRMPSFHDLTEAQWQELFAREGGWDY